ncbi:hypothetical protein [Blastococcus sp. TF02A-35]|uniref:hypothetical protein n=1 Tax=Blastococcus sp. TF02A-35 TaxID=2559612 RepID=UPI0010735B81|nr:hypothetical protein [Blastococcus sp. TF02A_35]TFV44846.1 hypothetical protein E4P43_18275 [Blastococcus sp. TF02A_35]
MSPENTTPVEPTPAPEPAAPAAEPARPAPNRGPLVALLIAVVVAALAVGGLFFYREALEDRDADTEAAVSKMVADQGAAVTTIECDGDTCAAIIGGSAYTVLVQEDDKGEQHFGVVPYAGD